MIEDGVPRVIKSDSLRDTVPSCVGYNHRGFLLVGEPAIGALRNDYARALENFNEGEQNTFIEFKRTMGTNTTYYCKNLGRSLNSVELSAEVLKKLKSLVLDENISSIVITIPAKFTSQQCSATMEAAKLAGFKNIVLLQEPIAAATAYGLKAHDKNGYWLVFDFGGGTFDAALLKVEDGSLKVKDTEGDNWLGGKNLDEAIVDQLILPYLRKHYALNEILTSSRKKQILRDALKRFAEEAKNQLSFKQSHGICTNLDDLHFKDENGIQPEINMVITRENLEKVVAPIFQDAIEITKALLKRNNMQGSDLDKLILVGGPTHSSILRSMLKEQITKNVDTSIDPMTIVASGAALYASSIVFPEESIQLEVNYRPKTTDDFTDVSIKVMEQPTGSSSSKYEAELVRSDGGWTSNKISLGGRRAALFNDVPLKKNVSNTFTINVYGSNGERIDCKPNIINFGVDASETIQLQLIYDPETPAAETDIDIKVKDTTGQFSSKYEAELVRADRGWRSAKMPITGERFASLKIPLKQGARNEFTINVYDNNGNRIGCEPAKIVVQPIIVPVLQYDYCIVKYFEDEDEELIFPIKGLEKNREISPEGVKGVINNLKTSEDVRPGRSDNIHIPIYQGDKYAKAKSNPELNNLVSEVIITGEHLPALLPKGSSVDLKVKIDRSSQMTVEVFFPALEHSEEVKIEIKNMNVPETDDLQAKIDATKSRLDKVEKAEDILKELTELEEKLENKRGSADGRLEIQNDLRKILLNLETFWPPHKKGLRDAYFELEEVCNTLKKQPPSSWRELNMLFSYTIQLLESGKIDNMLLDLRQKIELVIKEENITRAKKLNRKTIQEEYAKITFFPLKYLAYFTNNFDEIEWKSRDKAKALIDKAWPMHNSGQLIENEVIAIVGQLRRRIVVI
jgi:molecular chaperone DnaK (HSP70)